VKAISLSSGHDSVEFTTWIFVPFMVQELLSLFTLGALRVSRNLGRVLAFQNLAPKGAVVGLTNVLFKSGPEATTVLVKLPFPRYP
jgi:hypothetical protein